MAALRPKGLFQIKLSTSSDDPIDIHPEYDGYNEATGLRKSYFLDRGFENRVSYRFLKSEKIRYSMPLNFVNSSDQSFINSWWQANGTLSFTSGLPGSAFTLDDAANGLLDQNYNPLGPLTETGNVKILNQTRPLNSFTQNKEILFSGVLILMEV